jgi:hypothetical protein
MKSILAKETRKIFSSELSKCLPMFKALSPTDTKEKIAAGDRLYLWDYSEDLHFYLLLCIAPDKMGDAFTIEGMFTKYQIFPILQELSYPYGVPKSDIHPSVPLNGSMRFRIGYLFENPSDFWWWVRPNPSFEELNEWVKQPSTGDTIFMPQEVSDQEAINNINLMVNDAVNKIKSYIMPYFDKIIKQFDSHPNFWNRVENDKEV